MTSSVVSGVVGLLAAGPVGGVAGMVLGHIASKAATKVAFEKVENMFGYDENFKRAELAAEAFQYLQIDSKFLKEQMNCSDSSRCKKNIERSFRNNSHECHANSPKVIAMDEEEKARAKVEWELLSHAKEIAVGFFQNKDRIDVE